MNTPPGGAIASYGKNLDSLTETLRLTQTIIQFSS